MAYYSSRGMKMLALALENKKTNSKKDSKSDKLINVKSCSSGDGDTSSISLAGVKDNFNYTPLTALCKGIEDAKQNCSDVNMCDPANYTSLDTNEEGSDTEDVDFNYKCWNVADEDDSSQEVNTRTIENLANEVTTILDNSYDVNLLARSTIYSDNQPLPVNFNRMFVASKRPLATSLVFDDFSNTTDERNDAASQKQIKRCRTEEERKDRNSEKYRLLPPCTEHCRLQCYSKIDEYTRYAINRRYWELPFEPRRQWISTYIEEHETLATITPGKQKKRSSTLLYYLPSAASGTKIKVCKVMFMGTLDLHSDGIITS